MYTIFPEKTKILLTEFKKDILHVNEYYDEGELVIPKNKVTISDKTLVLKSK